MNLESIVLLFLKGLKVKCIRVFTLQNRNESFFSSFYFPKYFTILASFNFFFFFLRQIKRTHMYKWGRGRGRERER